MELANGYRNTISAIALSKKEMTTHLTSERLYGTLYVPCIIKHSEKALFIVVRSAPVSAVHSSTLEKKKWLQIQSNALIKGEII